MNNKILHFIFVTQLLLTPFVTSEENDIDDNKGADKNSNKKQDRESASSYFAQYFKSDDQNQEQKIPPKKLVSKKVDKSMSVLIPNSLFLRNAEIKLFAGHILHFLRVKCPKVDPFKTSRLQSFISNRTPEALHYASEKKSAFNQLLKSLRVCSSSNNNHLKFQPPSNLLVDQIMTKIHDIANYQSQYFSIDSIKEWGTNAMEILQTKFPIQKLWNKYYNNEEEVEQEEPEKQVLFYLVKDQETSKWTLSTSASEAKFKSDEAADFRAESVGEKEFREFLEALLKLYGQSCGKSKKLQVFFKAASNDLLSYFAIDTTRANLAAAKYLSPDFQQSVRECSAN